MIMYSKRMRTTVQGDALVTGCVHALERAPSKSWGQLSVSKSDTFGKPF